jgi:hypothetical protein
MQYISTFLVSHQAFPSSDDVGARTTMSNYKNRLRNVYEFNIYGINNILLGPMSNGISQRTDLALHHVMLSWSL